MTFRTASICFSAIAILGIAKLVTPDQVVTETAPRTGPSKTSRLVSSPRLSHEEILLMGPSDWQKHFDHTSVSPQARRAAKSLSSDLQELLATGADPQGEDARVYTDSIIALLTSNWEE